VDEEFAGYGGRMEEATEVVSGAVEKTGVRVVALIALDKSPTGRMLIVSLAAGPGVVDATLLVTSVEVVGGPGGTTMSEGVGVGVTSTAELIDSAGIGVGVM